MAGTKLIEGDQYYEDFEIGDVYVGMPVMFDQANIIAFAERYDPQPFHIDPLAAEKSMYGGLIASGWQVVCETFRALLDAGFLRGSGMGAPGIDELRWLKQVRPGDTVTIQATVQGKRESRSRNDRGYVDLTMAVANQKGELVMSYRVTEIVRIRG